MHANLVKRFQIRESWDFELRIDSRDVLNHPIWNNPNTDINSGDFGRITSHPSGDNTGARSVVVTGRLNF
jgi:hypothetical protein